MGEILEKSWRSACYNGELGEVKQMFKSVSPTFRERGLCRAASSKNGLAVVDFLVSAGVNPNCHDEAVIGYTPLLEASNHGLLDIVHFLVSSGANPNQSNQLGRSPLHGAAYNGQSEVCCFLIANGANPLKLSGSRKTAIDEARTSGHTNAIENIQKLSFQLISLKLVLRLGRLLGTIVRDYARARILFKLISRQIVASTSAATFESFLTAILERNTLKRFQWIPSFVSSCLMGESDFLHMKHEK